MRQGGDYRLVPNGIASGKRQRLEKQIETTETLEGLDSIKWSTEDE